MTVTALFWAGFIAFVLLALVIAWVDMDAVKTRKRLNELEQRFNEHLRWTNERR